MTLILLSIHASDGPGGHQVAHKNKHAVDLHGDHPEEEDWGNTPIDADFDFTHEPAG